jgi:ankyrin repeat protein
MTSTEKLIELCRNPGSVPANSVEKLRNLIDKRADLNVVVQTSKTTTDTPLLLACKNGADAQFIQILLENGADINIMCKENDITWTALSWLAHHSHEHSEFYEIIDLFIHNDKLNPNYKDNGGYTYFYDLFPFKSIIIEFIETHKDRIDPNTLNIQCFDDNGTILLQACKEYNDSSNSELIQKLLEIGADPNIAADDTDGEKDTWTPLGVIAHQSKSRYAYREKVIRLLINSNRLNPNTVDPSGYSYYFDLSEYPGLLLEFLNQKGAYTNLDVLNIKSFSYENTLIMNSCLVFNDSYYEIVKAQYDLDELKQEEGRGKMNNNQRAILVAALEEEKKKIAELYEKKEAYLKIHNSIVKKLVELGVELNFVNENGMTALDYLDDTIPENIPPGPIDEFGRLCLDTYGFLADNNAMTSRMLALRSTPAIKRPELSNNNNGNRKVSESDAAPSDIEVRNSFIRDWYHHLNPLERRVGGRRQDKTRKNRKRRQH